jgi:hypothetical protein
MVGFSQPCAQNVITAKNVKREIAVVIVITVEEPSFLFALQRQIGGIHVKAANCGILGTKRGV